LNAPAPSDLELLYYLGPSLLAYLCATDAVTIEARLGGRSAALDERQERVIEQMRTSLAGLYPPWVVPQFETMKWLINRSGGSESVAQALRSRAGGSNEWILPTDPVEAPLARFARLLYPLLCLNDLATSTPPPGVEPDTWAANLMAEASLAIADDAEVGPVVAEALGANVDEGLSHRLLGNAWWRTRFDSRPSMINVLLEYVGALVRDLRRTARGEPVMTQSRSVISGFCSAEMNSCRLWGARFESGVRKTRCCS
jgi:hypothetical protein